MRLLCPAKINLHLRVGPLRDDGFHPLLSWFCTAGLFDTLTLEQATPSVGVESSFVALSCDDPQLPCDHRNLVVKIGDAWAKEAQKIDGARVFPVKADLRKRIPAGAGLGGGSSDSARMLLGLNALWNAGRVANSLSGFAARLGSDLPFFLFGPSSVCSGRGEIVKPVPRPTPRWALLILPSIHMPTADVYRRFDAMRLGRTADIETEPDWVAWSKLDTHELMDRLVNDLEPAAFAISSALASFRQKAETILKRPVRMSGSGSSLFTLYDNSNEADLGRMNVLSQGSFARAEVVELAPNFSDDLNANL